MEITQINELATALAKFQGEIKSIRKNEENPFFKSNYADLAQLWDSIRESLSRNGLAVIQIPDSLNCNDSRMSLTTLVTHTSGQHISGTCIINLQKTDPQSVGSALTYYRRYALSAMLGLSTDDDDDDAEKAMDRKESQKPVKQPIKAKQKHFCPVHKTNWFKTDKMKSYAHPIEGTNEWCHESATSPGQPSGDTRSTKSVKEEAEPLIDLEWLKESLKKIQAKKVDGWSNKEIVSYLGSVTGRECASVSEAIRSLDKLQSENFARQIEETLEII